MNADLFPNRFVTLALLFCATLPGPSLDAALRTVAVDRFDQAVQNRLAGYRGAYQKAPSSAKMLRVDHQFRGVGGLSMRITATKRATGFCGVWTHFFDLRADKPDYFDAREFSYLSFWVKGRRGGESFDIRLADRKWIEKQDSIKVGRINDFLPDGVTTEWQEVIVPLPHQNLELSQLGGMTLDFPAAGEFTIYVDDISFKVEAEAVVPETNVPTARRATSNQRPKSMWLWSTESLLQTPEEWGRLFDFCERHVVGQLWMQLPYAMETLGDDSSRSNRGNAPPRKRCSIKHQAALRRFLRMAHDRQLKIHALDGAPEYCLRSQHAIPLAVVDAVIQFNRGGESTEHFDGIHFDNEPHLLVSWASRPQREEILREFLELNAECQRRVREQSKMEYGVDIPFWWQARDRTTGRCHGVVTFRGLRKAASYHCIDMLDNVGIMNYRDTADGADGMIAHGRDLLRYADGADGAKVFMGVETFAYKNRLVWFVVGLPRSAFDEAVRSKSWLADQSRFAGRRIRVLDDGEFVHLGLESPGTMSDLAAAASALRQFAAQFGMTPRAEPDDTAIRARINAQRAFASNPEWDDFRVRDVPADGDQRFVGFTAKNIMLSKVTFADDSCLDFREQTAAAENHFRSYEHYAGIAVHFYKTYRSLTTAGCSTSSDLAD